MNITVHTPNGSQREISIDGKPSDYFARRVNQEQWQVYFKREPIAVCKARLISCAVYDHAKQEG